MPGGKCKFNDTWLEDPNFNCWLKKMEGNENKAFCCLCKTEIDIINLGKSALNIHMKGKKHQNMVSDKTMPISSFFATKGSTHSQDKASSSVSSTGFVSSTDALKAEILWVIKSIVSHYSSSSCDNISQLFQVCNFIFL